MWWWQIRKRDADVERELQSDLELEEEEQREHGLPPEEARHAALRSFGNRTLISEETHAVWRWNGLESLLRDLRISVRTLFRSPAFSIVAVLVMALCIDRKSTRLNSSHVEISYAVFCLKKKKSGLQEGCIVKMWYLVN